MKFTGKPGGRIASIAAPLHLGHWSAIKKAASLNVPAEENAIHFQMYGQAYGEVDVNFRAQMPVNRKTLYQDRSVGKASPLP